MSSRRQLKAAEAIREVVSMATLTELQDPRVSDVTVVGVEVTPDMREAKVRVSILGDERKQELTLHGLHNAAGFLQSRIADRIETRYIPKLRFEVDRGLQNALAVGEILDRIRKEREDLSSGKTLDTETASNDADENRTGSSDSPADDQLGST